MESTKLKYLCFLLLILFLFITSCGNNEVEKSFLDRSFLKNEPCAAPCWYGLELEKSTEDDVYDVLRQLPFVKQDSIVQKGTGWMNDDSATSISYQCMYQKDVTCGSIVISKNKVVDIGMSVHYDLPLSLIVEKMGEPEYVNIHTSPGYSGCKISLAWPEKQISVSSDTHGKCPAPDTKINPNAKATYLVYTIQERFALVAKEYKKPWPGFSEP